MTGEQQEYDHTRDSAFTLEDCTAAVGKTALLPLTGRIVEAGHSPSGAFVKFSVDERWGLGEHRIVLDLDALEIPS